MTETSCFQAVGFCHWKIGYSHLFRILKFDIRILAESRQRVISVQPLTDFKKDTLRWHHYL